MEVKIPRTVFFAFLFYLLLLCSFYSSHFWHSFALKEESVSYALLSYDRLIGENSKACFSLSITASNLTEKKQDNIIVSANEKILLAERIPIGESSVKEYCFETSQLSKENLIRISIGSEQLFYELKKTTKLTKTSPELLLSQEVTSLPGKKAEIKFSVKNFPTNKIAPVEITVNNKLDHRAYPKKTDENFTERIELETGLNRVRVSVLGISKEMEVEHEMPFTLPLLAGLFLIAIALFALHSFVFAKQGFIGGAALSMASVIVLFIANAFFLSLLSLLNTYSFVVLVLIELLFLSFLFRKNFSLQEIQSRKLGFNLIEAIIVLFFFFVTLFLPLIVPSHQTGWSVYYERQANTVAQNFGIPLMDELSYLGRNFTFTPGYFLFEGALYWLTGSLNEQLFALTMAFSNLFFFLSALFLASRLGLDRNRRVLFLVFLSMSTFVFTTFTLTPRHGIALSLLFISLALTLGKKRWWYASIFLGIGFFVQLPLAVFFLFLSPLLMRKIDWKKIAKVFTLAFTILIPLYAFIPLSSGIPFQIMPRVWGYLISLPPYSLFQNPGILFLFFAFFLLFELMQFYSKKSDWDNYKKKLFAGVIVSLCIQVIVSSRWDLVTAVSIAAFLSYSLKKYEKELTRFTCFLFGLVLLFGLFLAMAVFPYFTYSQQVQDALLALKENSSTRDRILCDPFYGHKIAFESERITLADLMVEYADPEKLNDSYKFLGEEDYSILEKYSINHVFAENRFIHSSLLETEKSKDLIEFEEMDKFYSNSLISIHRKR